MPENTTPEPISTEAKSTEALDLKAPAFEIVETHNGIGELISCAWRCLHCEATHVNLTGRRLANYDAGDHFRNVHYWPNWEKKG